ncbi:MAG: ThiF family adenylyltransferase [Acidobacteria bacterium]|nr:ThiF family adenylyltransferase [Acidobacteriota bacterium]
MPISLEERYARQVLFPPIGTAGQQRLAAARVAIVGCGATGSVVASLLVRAGAGVVRLIDRDYVEPGNLHRQLLFDEADAEQALPKAVAAGRRLASANRAVQVEPVVTDLVAGNIHGLLAGFHLFMDGTDNFETRYLINDYAVQQGIPWIYCGAVGSSGTTMNIRPGQNACLSCIWPEPPSGGLETCDTAGILNSAAAAIASIGATEALKLLTGCEGEMRGTVLSLDLWTGQRAEVRVARAPSCRTCGQRDFRHLQPALRTPVTLCGRNSVQVHERNQELDLMEIETRLRPHGSVRRNEFVLKFCRESYEITLFRDGRAVIKGTTDHGVARSLYARYIGC